MTSAGSGHIMKGEGEVFWRHVCNRCGKEGYTDNNCAFFRKVTDIIDILINVSSINENSCNQIKI
jgi:hypothetical protein